MSEENEAYETGFADGQAAEAQSTASESASDELLATDFKPWDIVMLKGRTGRYRVYEWGNRDFIFACLDADVITTSGRDEVSEIVERSS